MDKHGTQKYYAKFLPAGEKKQRTLPGSVSNSAKESACILALFKASNFSLPAKESRAPRRSEEVS